MDTIITVIIIALLVANIIAASIIIRLTKARNNAQVNAVGNDDNRQATDTVDNSSNKTINVKAKPINGDDKYAGMDTPALLKAILKDLNCQYEEDERGNLMFTFQGESFVIFTNSESIWIRIYDLQWYDCSLDKLEEMSCMQKAINIANTTQSCTAVYDINKDDNKMIVYSKCDLVISSDLPMPDKYLAVWLSNFFHLKHTVIIEFEKEKQKIGLE